MEASLASAAGETDARVAAQPVEPVQPAAALLCLFAAVMPLAFAAPLFESYVAAKQFLLVAGAALAWLLWAVTARDIPVTPFWKPLAGLAALAILSLAHVTRFDTAIAFMSAAAILWVAVAEMREASRREQLALLIVAAGTLEAVYVLWQAIAGDPLFPTGDLPGKWRAFGTFGNPNWTGEFLAAAILVACGKLTAQFSRATAVCVVVMTSALAATFARGAWLALALGALAFAICRRGRSASSLRLTAWAAGGSAAGVATALAVSPQVRFYLFNLDSIRGRLWMWLVSLRIIADAPFGVGIGNFGARFPEVQARMFHEGWASGFLTNASFTPQAHNDYLQLIAEVGVLAVPCLAILLWMIARRGKSLSSDGIALGCWAAAVSLLFNGLYASPLYLPGSLAMIAILLGASEGAAARFRPSGRLFRGVAMAAGAACLVLAGTWVHDRMVAQIQLQDAGGSIAIKAWNRATTQLEIARRHDPGSAVIYRMTGRVLLAQREYTEALRVYLQALSIQPDVEAMLGKATAQWQAGSRAEAIEEMKKLVWLRPDLTKYQAQLAKLEAEK